MVMLSAIESRDPRSLRVHPENEQVFGCSESELDRKFLESVERDGILTPLSVTPDGMILSGHRRCAAAIRLGLEAVPVKVIRDLTSADIERVWLRSNLQRELSTVQRVRFFVRLRALESVEAAARQQAGVRVNFPQGRAADIAAQQIGISRRTAERLAEVLDVIDSSEASGDTATATRLLDALENHSAAAAHRAAVAAKLQTISQTNPTDPESPADESESREWTKHDARKFNASFTSIMRAIDRGKNLEQLTIIEHRDFMNTIQDFGDKWQDLFPQMEWI